MVGYRCLLSFWVGITASAVERRAQSEQCDDGTEGFRSLGSLRKAMEADFVAAQSSATPDNLYLYTVCKETDIVFEDVDSLTPLLDASVFRCGQDGANAGCRFVGGADQVVITDSQGLDVEIRDVFFQGITFTAFTNSALSGTATSATKVTLERVAFQDASSRYMVVQTAARGSAGFQVEISDSLVDSVTGGSLFSIASGNLVVENLTVTNVEAAAIVGSSGGSAVVLKDVKVTESTVQDGFMATGGSSLQLDTVDVSQMKRISGSVVVASGVPTETVIMNARIHDNDLRASAEGWNVVRAENGAGVTIQGIEIKNNEYMTSVFVATQNAALQMEQVVIEGASGTASVFPESYVMLIDDNSNAVVNLMRLDRITEFEYGIYVSESSRIILTTACFLTGAVVKAPVMVSGSSVYAVANNYIDNDLFQSNSDQLYCPPPNPRLVKEGDDCSGLDPCESTCETLADTDSCLVGTSTPVSSPPAKNSPTESTNTPLVPTVIISTTEPTSEPALLSDEPSMVPTVGTMSEPKIEPTPAPSSSLLPTAWNYAAPIFGTSTPTSRDSFPSGTSQCDCSIYGSFKGKKSSKGVAKGKGDSIEGSFHSTRALGLKKGPPHEAESLAILKKKGKGGKTTTTKKPKSKGPPDPCWAACRGGKTNGKGKTVSQMSNRRRLETRLH